MFEGFLFCFTEAVDEVMSLWLVGLCKLHYGFCLPCGQFFVFFVAFRGVDHVLNCFCPGH